MKLWSIQTEAAFSELKRTGRLLARKSLADPEFPEAYAWMVAQMMLRPKLQPPAQGITPIWAWYQYQSSEKPRPDLRCTGHLPRDEIGYRIEFDVDSDSVLLSDFDQWHFVLNYFYLPFNERDGEQFEGQCDYFGCSFSDPAPQPFDDQIRQSWQRIFDLEWSESTYSLPKDQKQIQATLWQIELDSVIQVTRFKAR